MITRDARRFLPPSAKSRGRRRDQPCRAPEPRYDGTDRKSESLIAHQGQAIALRSGLVGLGPSVFAGNMTCARY